MSIEFIDDSPPPRPGTVDWNPIAQKLEANPGKWALVDIGRKARNLRQIAHMINNHKEGAAARVRHGFDARVSGEQLYMRHNDQ